MTTRPDVARQLDDYYRDGPTSLSDRVVEAALAEIERTPQRRAGLRWRPLVPSGMRFIVAAGLVLMVAAGLVLLAGGRREAVVDVSPRPVASPVASAQPVASPVASAQPTSSAVPSQPAIIVDVPRITLSGPVRTYHPPTEPGPSGEGSVELAPAGVLGGIVLEPDLVRVVRSDRGEMTVTDVRRGSPTSSIEVRTGRPMRSLAGAAAAGWQRSARMVSLTTESDVPMTLHRFLSDGTSDADFGTEGSVLAAFPGRPMHPQDGEADMAIGADGSIVIVGGATFAIARFAADGQLDESFGDRGQTTVDVGPGHDTALSVALQADEKLVVVGQTGRLTVGPTDNDLVVVRLLPDGRPDPSFGTDGVTRIRVESTVVGAGVAVAVQADGRVVVLGADDADHQLFVVRLGPDGRLDPTFRSDATLRSYDWLGTPVAIAVEDDGRIVVLAERGLFGFDEAAYPDQSLGGALGVPLP